MTLLPMTTAIERPQRWDVPFSAAMRDEDVTWLMSREPFSSLDASRFPSATPLLGILLNDARLVRCRPGDLIVREGDYGSSAFFVLEGAVRVALDDLPPSLLGRRDTPKKSLWGVVAQLWSNTREPEARDLSRYREAAGVGRRDSDAGETRVFLQDVPGVLNRHRTVRLEAGEIFGELAALGRTPRTATVFADSDALLLEVRWQGLRDLRKHAPALKEFIDRRYRERSLKVQLGETPLLAGLDDAALQRVADATVFESFGSFDWYGSFKQKHGAVDEPLIAEEGHYPNGVILVRAGFARLSQRYGASEKTVGYLGKGRAFGLEEVLAGADRGAAVPLRASLRALGYVDLLRIPTAIIETLVVPHLAHARVKSNIAPSVAALGLPTGMLDELVDRRFVNGTATMVIDLSVCTRCDDCVRACSQTHDGNPRFLRQGPVLAERFMVANACMHCVDPVCMIGCPTGAIHRTAIGGQVVINDATCIGCSSCANSCPYEAIRMVEVRTKYGTPVADAVTGQPILKATKCDLCQEQLGGPACQRACPHDALRRVDMSDLPSLAAWTNRR